MDVNRKTIHYSSLAEMTKSNLESLSLLNLVLRLVNTAPALENSRSEGTDVAVIARYCFATAASLS
jgi:hypothetical protein